RREHFLYEVKELEDELTYDAAKLDRAVVSEDQLRTVIRTFRDKVLTEIFPGRPGRLGRPRREHFLYEVKGAAFGRAGAALRGGRKRPSSRGANHRRRGPESRG